MKYAIAILALAVSFQAKAAFEVHREECFQTSSVNTIICINPDTKAPCAMVGDTAINHVIAGRARSVRGYAYLNGTFTELGAVGDDNVFRVYTDDGVTWFLGDCRSVPK